MEYIITINSVTYDGEFASILFNPQDTDIVINLGLVQLPFTFNSGLLDPPREIYGNYTILVQGSDCSKTLRVPAPTPTPTPTVTPTRTPTPTPTPCNNNQIKRTLTGNVYPVRPSAMVYNPNTNLIYMLNYIGPATYDSNIACISPNQTSTIINYSC